MVEWMQEGDWASGKSHGGGVGTVGVTSDTCTLNLVEDSGSENSAWDLGGLRSPFMTEEFFGTTQNRSQLLTIRGLFT